MTDRETACAIKKQYISKNRAKKTAKKLGLHFYKCDSCGWYHLTKYSPGEWKRMQKFNDLINRMQDVSRTIPASTKPPVYYDEQTVVIPLITKPIVCYDEQTIMLSWTEQNNTKQGGLLLYPADSDDFRTNKNER